MSWINDLKNRLTSLVRRDHYEAELDEELRAHLEIEVEARIAAGEDPRSARRAARVSLGGTEAIKERVRDAWGSRWLHEFLRDLRGAGRRIWRYPRTSLMVIASLALGIGAATVVFSMVDAVLLRPLPFDEPDRLVSFHELTPEGQRFTSSAPNFLDFEERVGGIEALAAVQWPPPRPALRLHGERVRLRALKVTPSFFRVFRAPPHQGRLFDADDAVVGAEGRVAVLSYDARQRLFGDADDVIGRNLDLDGRKVTVVGVLPAGYGLGLTRPDVYLPFAPDPEMARGDRRLETYARLAPGVSRERAEAEAEAVAADLAKIHPESNEAWSVELSPVGETLAGPDVRRTQWTLLGAVGLLLLLACVNVSSLFLAQLADRRQDLRMRRALGAGGGRLLAQILTEALCLGGLGAAGGLALAHAVVPWIRRIDAPVPRLEQMTVDFRVAGFALCLAVGSALVFGLQPAWRAARGTRTLAAKRQGSDADSNRLRSTLVVAQVALATLLAIGAGLLSSSFQSLTTTDTGFDTSGVLLARIELPTDRYPEDSNPTRRFYDRLVERAAALPGVDSAAATMVHPYDPSSQPQNTVGTAEETDRNAFLPIHWRAVTPEIFRTLGIPLLRGPGFDPAGERRGMVVSRSVAEALWPGENAVGKEIRWMRPDGPLVEILGVAAPVQDLHLGGEPLPMVYVPQRVFAWPSMTLALRTAADPSLLAGPLRELLAELDPLLATPEIETLASRRRQSLAEPMLSAGLMAAFSALALLLASVGVYGIVAYAVSRRRRELGVRLALGARPRELSRRLAWRSLGLVAGGLAAGWAAAWIVYRTVEPVRASLYQTGLFEPDIVLGVSGMLLVVGWLAAALPARRAAQVDPMVVLREE